MVVQASSEARKPSLGVRVVAAWVPLIPVCLLTRRFAGRVLTEMPTRKPGHEEQYDDSIFGAVKGYSSHLIMSALDIARRAYGKYSSSRARDLLLSGQVKCFHSTVVLASRLTDVADAKAVLDSGKITDSNVREMIQFNMENPESFRPEGIWHRLGFEW